LEPNAEASLALPFGRTVGQTLRTWSGMETVISVAALAFVLVLAATL
jgi:GntP family gluconate:H+ symporter